MADYNRIIYPGNAASSEIGAVTLSARDSVIEIGLNGTSVSCEGNILPRSFPGFVQLTNYRTAVQIFSGSIRLRAK
jgi:hypothetical protein